MPEWLSLKRLAALLVGIAALFAALWALDVAQWVDTLAPNAITESVAIALALTVIDRIVERRDRERVLPLVDYTLDNIDLGLQITVQTIAIDYARSHRAMKELPQEARGLIDFWLENEVFEDVTRRIGDHGPWPYPTGNVFEFAESTYRQTESNRHDLITAGLTEIVMASKRLATSATLLQEAIRAGAASRDVLDKSLSVTDVTERREEAERRVRRQAIEILARFVREYEAQRNNRPPLRVPGDIATTLEHFRPVVEGTSPPTQSG